MFLALGDCDSVSEFTCVNGVCVPLESRFNGINDCGDNSDEGKYDTIRLDKIT